MRKAIGLLGLTGFMAATVPGVLAHELADPTGMFSVAGSTIALTAGDPAKAAFRLQNGSGETGCTTIYSITNSNPDVVSITPASGNYTNPPNDSVTFTAAAHFPGTATITVNWQIDPNNKSSTCFNSGNPSVTISVKPAMTTLFPFDSAAPFPLSFMPATTLAGDFDGQGGVNDVAVIEQNLGHVFILLNINSTVAGTTGTTLLRDLFTNSNLIPTSAGAFRDAITGLNDLAITDISTPTGNTGFGQIIVGLDTGQPTFFDVQQFRQFVATPGATNILNGDFNNDGVDDLAFVDFGSNFAAVALNDGTNFFLKPQFRETGGFVPVSAVVGDFNDDDNLDLVVLNQGAANQSGSQSAVTTLLGNGDGTLQPAGALLQIPNFALSIVGGLNDVGNVTRRVVDFNNDGFPDFAVASTRGGTTLTPSSYPLPSVTVLLNRPDSPGNFTAQLPVALTSNSAPPISSEPTDFAAQGGTGAKAVAQGPPNSPVIPMAVADFDGDGNQDLAVVNPATNTLTILRGDGKGGLTPAATFLTGSYPAAVTVMDVNGDGMPDLLVTNRNSRSIQAFINRTPPPATPLPRLTTAGLVNAASFKGGAVSPGEVVTFFGANMGPATLAGLQLDASGKVATLVAGTRVLFDGVPAPIVYTSAGQISAIVPYAVDGKKYTQIQVEYQGHKSNTIVRPITTARPALFTASSTGSGQGAILNQDFSVNSASSPAVVGSVIQIFATGEGQTIPAGVDGSVAGATPPKPVQSVKVTIGGQDAQVVYAGAAPGLVAGVIQVNATIPQGVASGAAPVVVTVGTAPSQSNVTVAVQ